jgi:pimeloyl-ACP methyl ester carboxylesterase
MSSRIAPVPALVSAFDVVAGIRMHACVSASASGDERIPLVFVHGLGVSVRYLEPTMVRLAGEHPVSGPDLPGFGRSGSPARALDVRESADALAGWLDARAVGPAIFIGNSYGCQVIVELVHRQPARALGLVLNAPTMDPAHQTIGGQLVRFVMDIPREPLRLAVLVARDYLRAGPLRFFATLGYALADRIEGKLPDLLVPVMIVCGARDPVVTVAWGAEAARLVGMSSPSAAGGTLHVVPTAAHALPFDDPATFAALIDAFAKRVRTTQQTTR